MALPPAPNTALVELIGTLDVQRIENTLYFFRSEGWDAAAMTQLSSLINNWFVNEQLPNLSSDFTYLGCEVTDLSTANGPAITNFISPALQGGAIGESMSNNVALCVSFRTPFRGRSARGRNYVSGMTTAVVNLNTFTQGFVDAVTGAYNLLPALGVALGATWCVLSRYANGQPRPSPTTFPITQAVVVDRTVDSQRRRLPGRGT